MILFLSFTFDEESSTLFPSFFNKEKENKKKKRDDTRKKIPKARYVLSNDYVIRTSNLQRPKLIIELKKPGLSDP